MLELSKLTTSSSQAYMFHAGVLIITCSWYKQLSEIVSSQYERNSSGLAMRDSLGETTRLTFFVHAHHFNQIMAKTFTLLPSCEVPGIFCFTMIILL